MSRPILRWPDPRLSQTCAAVGDADMRALAEEMLQIMYAAPGRGLAGPQIGVMQRIFVMDCQWKEGAPRPTVCIDPEIVEASEELATLSEGCLSIPGVLVEVTRPAAVRLRWRDASGARQDRWLEGFEARCAQHELDHLDGIVTFDRLDPEARASAEAAYRAALAGAEDAEDTERTP